MYQAGKKMDITRQSSPLWGNNTWQFSPNKALKLTSGTLRAPAAI